MVEEKARREGKTGRPRIGSREQSIYELIPGDCSRIQLKKLKKMANERGYGYDTLYNHLERLEEISAIKREVDSSARPPSVFYLRCPDSIPIWKGSKCWRVKFEGIKKVIGGNARLVFREDIEADEFQRQRLEQLFGKKPSKHRDEKIAAEIASGLLYAAALIGRALTKIKEGKGISITPDEYISRVLEIRLHPRVAQLARWVAENEITVPHLHDALMILASKVSMAKKR